MPLGSLFEPGEAKGAFVQIALERSMDAPAGFTYFAPASLGAVRVGDRVEAPLGRHDHRAAGYVIAVNVTPDIDPARIKPIRRLTGLRLPTSLVELATWIAGYYCCPLGMALSAMAPAAVKKGVGKKTITLIQPTGKRPTDKLPPQTNAAWEAIESLPADNFPIAPKDLQQRIAATNLGPINRLVALGVLETIQRTFVRTSAEEPSPTPTQSVQLTDEQTNAVEAISATLDTFTPHLLFGVTGSGKTEVYLRVLEKVIADGKCAIVLVPEISLTPQTVSRFVSRFHNAGVAVLHSGLTASARRQHWMRISTGEAKIAIGARSALFAPFDDAIGANLGLIIVDEEHDSAYKQDDAPRHHARDVALKRAQMARCPVILGSATPSLESWRNATLGKYQLHELTSRVGGASLPKVRIVDLADEMRQDTTSLTRVAMLGPTLRRSLQNTLESGGQAILLLNRRGWASYIACPNQTCGWTLTCDQCDVTMVHHRSGDLPTGGVVRCHHCLSEKKLPGVCPLCGRRVTTFGAGTQRVEQELRMLFPTLAAAKQMARIDSDTMRRAKDYFDTLGAFARGDLRLLLGTQMIAKGHDFPGVELVGVVNADTALNLPDFRAAERTFQLVSQVAGRAGRSVRPGQVIVQTFNPDQPAIRLASQHDFKSFAEMELALRRRSRLPPISRMARIVVRHERYDTAMKTARQIASALSQAQNVIPSLVVRGPMPCPIARISDRHRIAIELVAPQAPDIQTALTMLRNQGLAKNDAATAIDVDPISLM